jgi:Domain of unknown function (DUF1883)
MELEFLSWTLNHERAGTIVEFTLQGASSDVMLLDAANLASLQRGDMANLSGVGGHFTSSPVRLQIPTSGFWTAVVIPIGGEVTASIEVFRQSAVA